MHYKNKYLGTTTWDECADWLIQNNLEPERVVLLREDDIFNINKGTANNKYEPIDVDEMRNYIEHDLSQIRYPYQLECVPNKSQLIVDIEKASNAMRARMSRYGISSTFAGHYDLAIFLVLSIPIILSFYFAKGRNSYLFLLNNFDTSNKTPELF
jgi:hypothetical protein